MINIKIKQSELTNIKKYVVQTVSQHQKNVWTAVKNAREETIEDASIEIETLFSEHAGRHPEAENQGIQHFEFVKRQMMMGNKMLVGLEVRPVDPVGLFLMTGTDDHVIRPKTGDLLAFEFTEGGTFLGESTYHPGIESRIDEIEETVNTIFQNKLRKYLA